MQRSLRAAMILGWHVLRRSCLLILLLLSGFGCIVWHCRICEQRKAEGLRDHHVGLLRCRSILAVCTMCCVVTTADV